MPGETLAEIARRHGVELLLRFGSTAGGVTHAASDVDLAVLPRRGVALTFEWLGNLVADLASRTFPIAASTWRWWIGLIRSS